MKCDKCVHRVEVSCDPYPGGITVCNMDHWQGDDGLPYDKEDPWKDCTDWQPIPEPVATTDAPELYGPVMITIPRSEFDWYGRRIAKLEDITQRMTEWIRFYTYLSPHDTGAREHYDVLMEDIRELMGKG